MHILISNDDGYQAPGINALKNQLREAGHQVTIVAPNRNRSACSSLLTVVAPLKPVEVEPGVWYVEEGTPADCVHLALGGLFDFVPDMVCAGINDCANLGDDTIYSGTVAAVIEARHVDIPKVAFSLDGDADYDFSAAARIAVEIIEEVYKQDVRTILNVNIPALEYAQINGWRITRLGSRVKSSPITSTQNEQGERLYYIGEIGRCQDSHAGTDFEALEHGYVSITPLHTDLSHHALLDSLHVKLGK